MTELPSLDPPKRRLDTAIGLALLGALLVAFVLLWFAGDPANEPRSAEAIEVARITAPRPGLIVAEIVNTGFVPVVIAQVQVDGAFWEFAVDPPRALPRRTRATLTIPYPWVEGETHRVTVFTGSGATFVGAVVP